MHDWDQLLRTALEKLKNPKRGPIDDLVACLSQVTNAVVEVTNGQYYLKIELTHSKLGSHDLYHSYIENNGNKLSRQYLEFYKVHHEYPIKFWKAPYERVCNWCVHDEQIKTFNNKEDIAAHTLEMVSSSKSPLVRYLSEVVQ